MAENKQNNIKTPPPKIKKPTPKQFFGKLFLEQNVIMSFINGIGTGAVIFYWFVTKETTPIFIWFGLMLFLTIIRAIYWRNQIIKTDKELRQIEGELKDLNQKIKEGKKYFDGLRKRSGNPPAGDQEKKK